MLLCCPVCRKEFTPWRKDQKNCSRKCSSRGRAYGPLPLPRNCNKCNIEFQPIRKTHVYCTACGDPRTSRRVRHGEITRLFKSERAFNDEIERRLLASQIRHSREVSLADGVRADFLIAGVAVESKTHTNTGRIYAAIGQLIHYRMLTGKSPVLLVPSDTQIRADLLRIIESVPARVVTEQNLNAQTFQE